MTSQTAPAYYYPNKMGRIVLLAMEELVGHNGMIAVMSLANLRQWLNNLPPNDLDLAFSFEEMGRLQGALESIYGPRSGRGLALRVGRACFKYGIREFGPLLGCMDLSFRLLPLETKLHTGVDLFADIFNRYTDQRVRIEEREGCFLWHIERCPVCWQRHSDSAVCHLAVGLLQEALYWVSGGKSFHVEEVACIAKGDPVCTILIEKQSLD